MLAIPSISSPNAPNFKAKIRFSQKAYDELPFKEMIAEKRYVGSPFSIAQAKILGEGLSEGAADCTMGFFKVKGAQEGYFFHCSPIMNTFEEVKNAIIPVIQKFKEYGKQIEGILIGANENDEKSFDRAVEFMDLFDDFGIEYSAILLQKPLVLDGGRTKKPFPRVNMVVSAPKDEYMIDFVQGSMPRNMEDLDVRFDLIKKGPHDEFIFEPKSEEIC